MKLPLHEDYSQTCVEADNGEFMTEKEGQRRSPFNAYHNLAIAIVAEKGFFGREFKSYKSAMLSDLKKL